MTVANTQVHCLHLGIGVPKNWDPGFTAIVAFTCLNRVRDCYGRRGMVCTKVSPKAKFRLTVDIENQTPAELQEFVKALTRSLRCLARFSHESFGELLPDFHPPTLVINGTRYAVVIQDA